MHWGNGAATRLTHMSFMSITSFFHTMGNWAHNSGPLGQRSKMIRTMCFWASSKMSSIYLHLVIVKTLVISKDDSGNLC